MKIAIIGGGRIGSALIGGLVDGGVEPGCIRVAETSAERRAEVAAEFGVVAAEDAASAADGADVAFVCVKPHDVMGVLESIAGVVDEDDGDMVVVSMAAGLTLEAVEGVFPVGTPVVRVMPNTPMLVRRGMCAVARGRFCGDGQLETVASLLGKVGAVEVVAESQMDAVTAVSGSGPAYFFQFIEAMCDAGVDLGLTREQTLRLASETMAGAAEMLLAEGADPVRLRADVSSPAGTTVAATRTLDEEGLRGAVSKAMRAARDRSVELGRR
ncbi:pyrroline-5-carboxylate reductase [Corynebacterium sp. 335C]